MKVTKYIITAFIAVSLIGQLGAATHISKEVPDKKTTSIFVKNGAQFSIMLDSNPSTGYSWKLADPIETEYLEFIGSTFIPKERQKMMVGVGGTEVWTFKALKPGKTTIKMEYSRPDGTVGSEKEFKVRIK